MGFYDVYKKIAKLHPEKLKKTGCKNSKILYTSINGWKRRQNEGKVDIRVEKLDVYIQKIYIPPIQEYGVCCIKPIYLEIWQCPHKNQRIVFKVELNQKAGKFFYSEIKNDIIIIKS